MLGNVEKGVRVLLYAKIKSPVFVDPRLPAFMVIFFCMKGGVSKVLEKISGLLIKRPLNAGWCIVIAVKKAFGVAETH